VIHISRSARPCFFPSALARVARSATEGVPAPADPFYL
jgi:hypothetical protein